MPSAAFTAAAVPRLLDPGFTTFQHALAHLKSGDIRALPDSYLDTLIEGPAPARRYGEGGTEAELNMAKLNALLLLSRRQGSPHYKGFYLHSALAKLPPGGFYRFRIDLFPRDKVWPYLASRFPLLDRAIGRKPALPFDPYIDRLRALRLLHIPETARALHGNSSGSATRQERRAAKRSGGSPSAAGRTP